ncbi:cobW-domain-containing protein [Marasmius fiardii PR-910]|nr:cobW-domain-containing protein [Marasmius fiardii PR-910]
MSSSIPITVFTGFLGAGKTSIILGLLPQLPKDYKVVLLKNEFGDLEVDSKLAKESSLTAVSEILNGCMCCVLVGQMQNALLEIQESYHPDRIIIECSGSAFPATLAFQIRELEKQTNGALKLDSIVTVIDAENFVGYEDTSPTARMQASYTDLLLINKWEHVSDQQLDIVLDHLHTLNDLTPKIRCKDRKVDPNLIFGLESKLFMNSKEYQSPTHNDEVQTIRLSRGGHAHPVPFSNGDASKINRQTLDDALQSISKESVWRVKGFIRLDEGDYIFNWAFGRYDLIKSQNPNNERVIDLTAMGERREVRRAIQPFCRKLALEIL